MTDYPWFKFDVAKERALMDTLTDEQYGAHMRLRIHAWTSNGLPSRDVDVQVIGRWKRAQWDRIWPAISRYWKLDVDDPSRLVNHALEAERLDVEARSNSGRNAVVKRWQKVRNTPVLRPNYQESTEQNTTEQDKRERENSTLSLVTAREGVYDLSPGQLQASVSGLVGAWNNIVAIDGKPFVPVTIRSHPKATEALRRYPSIDWWSDIFRRVAASDYLGGRVSGRDGTPFRADFWWCLENAEKIASGRYDNRARVDGNEAVLARVLKDLA